MFFFFIYCRCSFRVQGENENGRGKWSEESLIVVPGRLSKTPKSGNSNTTEPLSSKKKKKRKRKKNANSQQQVSNLVVQFRSELNEILSCPTVEVLQSFIKRLKSVELSASSSPELRHVLEDALTALEIKEEELALRSHIARHEKKKLEDEILWAKNAGKNTKTNSHSNSSSHHEENKFEEKTKNQKTSNQNITDQNTNQNQNRSGNSNASPQAEKTLRQLGRVAAVRTRLKEALSSSNIEELETAIEMAEQWENSQLHCEIQAASDMIRKLSLASSEKSQEHHDRHCKKEDRDDIMLSSQDHQHHDFYPDNPTSPRDSSQHEVEKLKVSCLMMMHLSF